MQPILRKHQPAQPMLAVGFIVSSVYLGLSLFSYSPKDPSWTFSTSQTKEIQNLGGIVGSWTADVFLQAMGIVAYILVGALFYIGIRFVKDRVILLDQNQKSVSKKSRWKIPSAIILGSLCLSGLLSLLPYSIYQDISLGGALGALISEAGVLAFSTVGSILLFIGGLWTASVMISNRINPFSFVSEDRSKETSVFQNTLNKIKSWVGTLKIKINEKLQSLKAKPSIHESLRPRKLKFDFSFLRKSREEETLDDKEVNKPTPVVTSKSQTPVQAKETGTEESDSGLFNFSLFNKEPKPGERQLLMKTPPKRKAMFKSADYDFPSLQLLDIPHGEKIEVSRDELIEHSKALEQKLLDFGIQGRVKDIRPGPIITLYEFEPAPGVKVKNITNLTDDLKLAMKATSVRIIAPIPGKSVVGIEIPNRTRQTVHLREILESNIFQNSSSNLSIALGKTTSGEPYVADLAKMPHLLVAGATGSGKSVGINTLITSMLFKASPEDLKFIMIDPKMLELSVYDGIPHLLLPVVTDPKKAARALRWAVKEMERRYKLISALGARNLASYNKKVEQLSEEDLKREMELAAQTEATTSAIIDDDEDKKEQQELALKDAGLEGFEKLPQIVVVIDELADLIMVASRDVEESIARLAQMARAAGIHLVIATQRPSVDVITGVIKANLPTRIAYQVASKVDSRTIIDGQGAENLIGDGDMLFLPPGTSRLVRLHGPFISEDEISSIVRHLKRQGQPSYAVSIDLEESARLLDEAQEDADDSLYQDALDVVFETQSPSASMLQRRLRVGYNRAARMIERMEAEGVISPPQGGGKGRELLIQK